MTSQGGVSDRTLIRHDQPGACLWPLRVPTKHGSAQWGELFCLRSLGLDDGL